MLVDFIGAEETGYHRWDREIVKNQLLPHLHQLKSLGFDSLVECTPAFLGRDPRLLRLLATEIELNIITNTGYYGARENKFIPLDIQNLSVDALAKLWIEEFENGIEGTDIRPGFIKIGVDREPQLSAIHEKLIRAACRTHLITGLTIACHTGPTAVIFQMVEILLEEGVAPDALIWVHATLDTPKNQIKAAKLGLWISIDNVTNKANRIDHVSTGLIELKKAGLLHRVLISHDAGWYRPGEPDGGSFRPYTAISESLIPKLRSIGFTQANLDQLLIENPAQAFAIRVRR